MKSLPRGPPQPPKFCVQRDFGISTGVISCEISTSLCAFGTGLIPAQGGAGSLIGYPTQGDILIKTTSMATWVLENLDLFFFFFSLVPGLHSSVDFRFVWWRGSEHKSVKQRETERERARLVGLESEV